MDYSLYAGWQRGAKQLDENLKIGLQQQGVHCSDVP
jgi:hypothetical protein